MISSKEQYENTVVEIFNLIISGQRPCPEDFPKCTEKDFNEILFQCVNDGLILGYSATRVASGDAVFSCVGEPYVTLKGLNYMDSIKQARALEVAENAQKNSVLASIKANISYILSMSSLVFSILINLDKIVANLLRVLSYLGLR